MTKPLEYEVHIEPPTLDHYRYAWTPRDGFELAAKWPALVATGESGREYFGIRGYSDFVLGMTHSQWVGGFRQLSDGLDARSRDLYPELAAHGWFEPFRYVEEPEQVSYIGETNRVDEDATGCHWSDADGRWQIDGQVISDTFWVFVPEQEGIDRPVFYRHELGTLTGTINDDPVEGYLHQDFCYGPPGYTYMELPIMRQLEGLWFSWIHEHTDGTRGGGCLWSGRRELDFHAGYLLHDGVTTVHKESSLDLTFGEIDGRERPTEGRVEIGGHWFEFEYTRRGGPSHYFGRLVASDSGKEIAKSWCWLEYTEVMTEQMLGFFDDRLRLARRK